MSSGIDVRRLVELATRDVVQAHDARYAWEVDDEVSAVMGLSPRLLPTVRDMMPITTFPWRIAVQSRPATVAYHPLEPRKRRRLNAHVVEAGPCDNRAQVLAKWLAILEVNLFASSVGKQLLREQGMVDAKEKITAMLDDVFAKKTTATHENRVTAILL